MHTCTFQRRMSRRGLLSAIGASAALLVVACGAPPPSSPTGSTGSSTPAGSSGSATSPSPAASQPTTAPNASAPASGGANIQGKQAVLWGLKYDPHVERYNLLSEAFTQKTGAKLTIQPQPGPLETKVIAAIAARTAPDVGCIMGKALLPLYLRKTLINVSDLFREWNIDPQETFAGDSIDAYTYGQQIWGVPVEVNLHGAVSIPIDAVEEAGLTATTPPKNGQNYFDSYEHMWETAKALMVKEGDEVKRWGISAKGWEAQNLFSIMRSQGVAWWDENTQQFNVSSEAGVKAFELLVETPVKLGLETELNQHHVDAALAGKIALAYGNASVSGEAKKVGLHYEMVGAPPVSGTISDSDPLFIGEGGWGFVGIKGSANEDVAVEFLRFIATEEAQEIYSQIYGGIPSAWRALNSPDHPRWGNQDDWVVESWTRFAKHVTERTVYFGREFGYIAEISKHVASTCSEVRQGKMTAQQAATTLQELCQQQYQQYQDDLAKM